MAQTFSPTPDALSLQRGVEGRGLQPSRGSSGAPCGQETSAQLHPLAWQRSWGEVHFREKPASGSPSPCTAVRCCGLSTMEKGSPAGAAQSPCQPGPLGHTARALLSSRRPHPAIPLLLSQLRLLN